jgi:molecular chaperone DnaK
VRHRVAGIDLGTTYSAVAVWDQDEDQAEILLNREEGGQATTPSVVAFDPAAGTVSVGWAAKRSLAVRPQHAVTEIKREMGEQFSDRSLQRYGAQDRFSTEDPVQVHFAGAWRRPQEISALILTRMKEIAETELGEEIRDAVITVPAYFLEIQRKATEQAARLAGLWPRRLVEEPTAAAICYGVDQYEEERRAYLVYDLGGGTFDVSIIQVEGEDIRVIATSGDHHLGGGDFDDAIVEWAVKELAERHGLQVADDERVKPRIKYHAEQAKFRLSAAQETTLELPELRREAPPVLTLTRERFEDLIEVDIQRSLRKVEDAIHQAAAKGVGRDQLDAVLLVGGSTKIPKVKRTLVEYFRRGEDFVKLDLDPAAVVARGAAILARTYGPSDGPFDPRRQPQGSTGEGEPLPIEPITAHSLGTGLEDGTCHRLIHRGMTIPVSQTDRNFTNSVATDTIHVGVYQGEGQYFRENTLIGDLVLDGLEFRQRGEHHFDLTYSLDENGLLSVRAEYADSGRSWDATINHPTLVEGNEALLVRYEQVQRLYRGGREPPAAPEEPDAPPPP